ncbi:MAG: hypothetical protein K8I27_10365 [Planctomycetes bacterium]|nr:hypothetical protein [Planctomycetota bacterium]
MPSNQALWEKNKDRGLHVFLVESQGGTLEDITQYAKDRKLTLPLVIRNGSNFDGYKGGNGLPYAFVVGPDGKVVWQGRSGYEAIIEQQLERIKYPGLGKLEVAPECTKAAEKFGSGDFAGARDEAVKVQEKEADNEAALADADYIIKRVDGLIDTMRAKIEDAKSKRRYHDAVRLLDELSGKGFKGMEVADKAKDEAKELKKEQKDELKAWEQFEKTLEVNEKAKSDGDKKKNLVKFYEKYEGTAAADEAKAMADGLSD